MDSEVNAINHTIGFIKKEYSKYDVDIDSIGFNNTALSCLKLRITHKDLNRSDLVNYFWDKNIPRASFHVNGIVLYDNNAFLQPNEMVKLYEDHIIEKVEPTEDDTLQELLDIVDMFCAEMKTKLIKKSKEGEGGGWGDSARLYSFEKEAISRICDEQQVDAANFLCMVWNMTGRSSA